MSDLMIDRRGAGITLEAVTAGLVPFCAGTLVVSMIVLTCIVLQTSSALGTWGQPVIPGLEGSPARMMRR